MFFNSDFIPSENEWDNISIDYIFRVDKMSLLKISILWNKKELHNVVLIAVGKLALYLRPFSARKLKFLNQKVIECCGKKTSLLANLTPNKHMIGQTQKTLVLLVNT